MTVDLEVEAPAWLQAVPDVEARVLKALEALERELGEPVGTPTLLLTDNATVRDLNARFRGRDEPTNVLSFPSGAVAGDHLGDIALAYETCVREAAEAGKPLADHLSHLCIHGALHLLGWDHEVDADAEAMEAVERRALGRLGVADPYADRAS